MRRGVPFCAILSHWWDLKVITVVVVVVVVVVVIVAIVYSNEDIFTIVH